MNHLGGAAHSFKQIQVTFPESRETLRRVWAHPYLTARSVPCRVTSHPLWDLGCRQEHHIFDLAHSYHRLHCRQGIGAIYKRIYFENGKSYRLASGAYKFFPDLSASLGSWSDQSHLGQDWLRAHFVISLLPCYLIPHYYCSWILVCICIGLFIWPLIICFYIKNTGFYGCARLICIRSTAGEK